MRADPIELEIFKNLFHSVAEEMGAALRRSGFSPNIKERRDYSCAVFDGEGRAVAMGDHMPVHLGSMPASVAAAIAAFQKDTGLGPGDVAVLNDPFAGGTHLPDLTMVAPVFVSTAKGRVGKPFFYVANRAHHSDIGGAQPASMGLSEEIYQEGLRIPPVRLFRQGKMDRDGPVDGGRLYELIEKLRLVNRVWLLEGLGLGSDRVQEIIRHTQEYIHWRQGKGSERG